MDTSAKQPMKRIARTQFKAQCLQLLDQVERTQKPILITKRGKPIAKLVPVRTKNPEIIGRLKGIIKVVGDIVSPAVPPEDWEIVRMEQDSKRRK
jgi:prevent-host-death family protein